MIESGEKEGIALEFESLGIINGIIDEAIQAPHYPEFAVKNTYGIKSVSSHPCQVNVLCINKPDQRHRLQLHEIRQ